MPCGGQRAWPVLTQIHLDGDPLAACDGLLLAQHRILEVQWRGGVDLEQPGALGPVHPEGPAVHAGAEQYDLPDPGRGGPLQQVVEELRPDDDGERHGQPAAPRGLVIGQRRR